LLLFSTKYFVFPSQIKKPNIKIYKTVILPVVLRVFKNRVLRKIYEPKREEDGS
jgi:hypothetical protein